MSRRDRETAFRTPSCRLTPDRYTDVRRHRGGTRAWCLYGLLLAVVFFPLASCGNVPRAALPNESDEPVDTSRFELLARFVHITDAQIVDEESPARLAALADFSASAWRPHEAYSTQVLDGMIRTINKLHVARDPIDFVVHTGDALDNAQANELDWFVTAFDGGRINPRSGPDDRDPASKPDPVLDPHEPFDAQGLYRQGVHGDQATIPWYSLFGNHDHFASGVFPIVYNLLGQRVGPLPLGNRIGFSLPVNLYPIGAFSWGLITPANPGPPASVTFPIRITPNTERAYITDADFIAAHLASSGEPLGHGFAATRSGHGWYSVMPVPGVRLIALNSATPILERPRLVYSEGAVSPEQVTFLKEELGRACRRGERVIVATHHPAVSLDPTLGTALTEASLVRLLNEHPCVILHIDGHLHQSQVIDRSGYIEITTSAIIDAPQQGRVIEIWEAGDDVELRYRMFSHLDEIDPPTDAEAALFDDPLMPMRRIAADLAGVSR